MKKQNLLAIAAAIGLSACQSGGGATRIDDGDKATEPVVGVIVDKDKQPEAIGVDDGPVNNNPEGTTRVDTVEKLSVLFDKKLQARRNEQFYIRQNGRMIGTFGTYRFSANWQIRDGYFCREITSTPKGNFPKDCQVLTITGNMVHFVREKGAGQKFTYTIVE